MRLRSACLALAALLGAGVGGSPLFNGAGNLGEEPNHDRARRIPRSHVRHEWHDGHLVEGWKRRERASANATLPMRVGLVQSEDIIQKGHDKLMDM
jgi:hypothetical protein